MLNESDRNVASPRLAPTLNRSKEPLRPPSDDLFLERTSSPPAHTAPEVWSVSRLSAQIRRIVEEGLSSLWLEGEISNFKLHSSGHRYFTLKDESAQIACVMWRTKNVPALLLQDGLKIRAYGRVTVWEQAGRYQFDVQNVLPAGVGSLQAAFEGLKGKLAAEGLFAESRKKRLPRFPQALGIVTSPTGAVIHDLVWGFTSRFPPARLFLLPVAVQGEGAATQIAAAIETFNRLRLREHPPFSPPQAGVGASSPPQAEGSLVDVIVVARGGGSLEDLWAFNEEVVVRSVAGSRIPVVSAIGHEVDITLCDLAADVRAPTPTAAAALVVPDRKELREALEQRRVSLGRQVGRTVTLWRERLAKIGGGYGFRRLPGRVGEERLRLDETARRMEAALDRWLEGRRRYVAASAGQLAALSPRGVLTRGYCIARKSDGTVVRRSFELSRGDKLEMTFGSGGAGVNVEGVWSD